GCRFPANARSDEEAFRRPRAALRGSPGWVHANRPHWMANRRRCRTCRAGIHRLGAEKEGKEEQEGAGGRSSRRKGSRGGKIVQPHTVQKARRGSPRRAFFFFGPVWVHAGSILGGLAPRAHPRPRMPGLPRFARR